MRVFHILPGSVSESSTLPMVLPEKGYLWIACGRREFEVEQGAVQSTLQVLCGMTLVDLHISDLLNNQLPSHYDYTSQYDILVFRRLAAGHTEHDIEQNGPTHTGAQRPGEELVEGRVAPGIGIGRLVHVHAITLDEPGDHVVGPPGGARVGAPAGEARDRGLGQQVLQGDGGGKGHFGARRTRRQTTVRPGSRHCRTAVFTRHFRPQGHGGHGTIGRHE